MQIRIVQAAVGRDLTANLARVTEALDETEPGEVAVFPEGMLSGYAPEDDRYTAALDAAAVEAAIAAVRRRVDARRCGCLLGTATYADGAWRNSVLAISGSGEPARYHKRELSRLDRRHFSPGAIAGQVVALAGAAVGVLACREVLFPAAWQRLQSQGARIVFHLNNAIQPQDDVWRHVLIARAVESGIFVCSVNNGAWPQRLPSMLVAPSGRVLLESRTGQDDVLTAAIDLDEAVQDLTTRTDY